MNDASYAVVLLAKAANFAAQAHHRQRRKDKDETPYINHLTEVAHLLADAGCDVAVVAAGYLHDTIEDPKISHETLVKEFGEDIANLVQSASDDKRLDKAVRKELQVKHAAQATPDQAALKLADKISNLRSICLTPPAKWSEERRQEYVAWADHVVTQLPSKNDFLMKEYHSIRQELLGSHAPIRPN